MTPTSILSIIATKNVIYFQWYMLTIHSKLFGIDRDVYFVEVYVARVMTTTTFTFFSFFKVLFTNNQFDMHAV